MKATKDLPTIDDIVKVDTETNLMGLSYTNDVGGTSHTNSEFAPKFKPEEGFVEVKITASHHDYETGYQFRGVPVGDDLKEYLKENSLDGIVRFSEWDLV